MGSIKTEDLEIDWAWVRKELLRKERIPAAAKDGAKHIIRAAADECLEKAESLVKSKVVSKVKRIVNIKDGSVRLEGAVIFSGRRLASYIKGAERAHLFLVTLGSGIENEASLSMSKGEPLRGYLLDRIGSFAVESLAVAVEEKLRKAYAACGKSISMRLSPGYCDWPIEEQFILAKALDFSRAAVRLTKNCMMVPRKSISAMVAIGPKRLFSKENSQCVICDKKDCDHRRSVRRVQADSLGRF